MYYPLSQIKTNLYTNGDEFVITLTQIPYVGFYYKTSKGNYFTGKTPQDLPTEELSPILDTSEIDTLSNSNAPVLNLEQINEKNISYIDLKNIPENTVQFLPYYNPQQPTQQDYQNGEFRRFFCKKTNEILYIEINKDQYDKLIAKDPQILWQLYLPFNITWQLTGDEQQVARVNKNMVELAIKNLKLPKFNLYIKEDYTKYYQ